MRGPDAGGGGGGLSCSTLKLHCNCRAAGSSKSLYSASHSHHTPRGHLYPRRHLMQQMLPCQEASASRVHLSPHNSPSSFLPHDLQRCARLCSAMSPQTVVMTNGRGSDQHHRRSCRSGDLGPTSTSVKLFSL